MPHREPTGRGSRLATLSGLAALALAVVATTCDKVPLLAPSGTTITLFATSSSVPVNGTTEVTATVIESAGTPVQNGTVVTFVTSLGSIDPQEARTQGGKVTARFHAGSQSGTAQIRAVSGGASSTGGTDPDGGATGGALLEILVGGAGAAQLILSASPATVSSSGGTSRITAVVLDASGNRLGGVPVVFTTDAGILTSGTVVTGGSGEARTSLTTNRETVVMASAGSLDAQQVTVGVSVAPGISVTTDTASPMVGQPTAFTVSVTPDASNRVQSVTLDFGDGQSQGLGALNGTTGVTHTYQSAGTFTVTATAIDANGEATAISTVLTVLPAGPLNVTITASPLSPTVKVPVSFFATVTPATAATYHWTFGDGGVATTTGGATSHVYQADGIVTVTLTVTGVDGTTGTGVLQLFVAPAPATMAPRP